MKKIILRVSALFFLLMFFSRSLLADIAPQVTVPKCLTAPVIDGVVGADEWQGAAAVTGFVEYEKRRLDPRQAVAFITYDDKNLYLAFKLPVYPAGAALIANYEKRDGQWYALNGQEYSSDDILEVFLDPHFGDYKAEDKFYQFMGNFRDFILLDQASAPAIGILEQKEWNGRWTFKNRLNGSIWESELSIPLSDLGSGPIADGTKWLAHFSRIWGANFSWTTFSPVPGALNAPTGGARLVFDAQAPAVRLLDVTPLLSGKVGFNGEIVNGNKEASLSITTRVTPFGGTNALFEKTWPVNLKPKEVYPLSLDQEVKLADTNTFTFRVTDSSSGKVLAENEFSFLKIPAYPIFPSKVRHAFQSEVRYFPYTTRVWIDNLNFTQFPKRGEVAETRLSIFYLPAGTDNKRQEVFSGKLPAKDGRLANYSVSVPGAVDAEGQYEITISLLDSSGKELASDSKLFLWRKFPFVGYTAGLNTPIIPPYQPIVTKNNQVKVLGREYLLDDLALFAQLTANQAEPTVGDVSEPLLASPLSLSLTAEGAKPLSLKPSGRLKLVSSSPIKVTYQSAGTFPNLKVDITNDIEYDGLAWLTFKITPTKPVKVESLVFDIPLRETQATLLHEVTDEIRHIYAGFTPAGTGRVWDSTKVANTSLHGNFKPLFWLGNEDRGLTWCGESDRGWYLDETKPAIEVIRLPGKVVLRLNLVNKPLLLSEPRTISFGLQATPVKTLPAGWRSWVFPHRYGLGGSGSLQQEPLNLANLNHFTFDQYAIAVPYFKPYPNDWDAWRNLNYSYAKDKWTLFTYRDSGAVLDPKISPEYEVYLDEWIGVRGYGAASFRDFRAWAEDQMLKRCGLEAFYEDNAYVTPRYDPAFGVGYIRDDGQQQGELLFRSLRELLRRDAALYSENHMPNYSAVHKSTTMMTPCYAFTTFAIDGEQRFMDTAARDYIDSFPLEYIRAHIMGRQFGLVPMFLSEIKLDANLQQAAIYRGTRSELALLLLHEIQIWPEGVLDKGSLRATYQFMDELNIGAPDVVFHPYWANKPVAQTQQANVKISLWARKDKAVAVIANFGDEQEVRVQFDFARLGFKPKTCKNYENKGLLDMEQGGIIIRIPRHDYKLIWMER